MQLAQSTLILLRFTCGLMDLSLQPCLLLFLQSMPGSVQQRVNVFNFLLSLVILEWMKEEIFGIILISL